MTTPPTEPDSGTPADRAEGSMPEDQYLGRDSGADLEADVGDLDGCVALGLLGVEGAEQVAGQGAIGRGVVVLTRERERQQQATERHAEDAAGAPARALEPGCGHRGAAGLVSGEAAAVGGRTECGSQGDDHSRTAPRLQR